jgi:hypothetical protein
MEPSDILSGPLTQFQAKRSNKAETWELVRTLNGALDNWLTDEQLKRGFERCWNELDTSLKQLPPSTSHQETRSEGDKLTEVLEVVRTLSRAITDNITPRLESLTNPTNNSVSSLTEAYDERKMILHENVYKGLISKIVSILEDGTPVKYTDILSSFKPMERSVVRAIVRRMKEAGDISYDGTLDGGTLISHVDKDEHPDVSGM